MGYIENRNYAPANIDVIANIRLVRWYDDVWLTVRRLVRKLFRRW